MECKLFNFLFSKALCKELIDTLWNVNFLDDESSKYALIELIDTLWNVNPF